MARSGKRIVVLAAVLWLAGSWLGDGAFALDKIRHGSVARSGLYWTNYVMTDKGFLGAEGIEVEPIVAGSTSRAIQYLVSGSVDIADCGPDGALIANEKGGKLLFVAANIWVPPFRLVAAPSIASVEALRGKKIAASALKTGEIVMTKKILKAHGLDDGDYEIVVIAGSPERDAALKKGAVHATALSQPFDFEAEAAGFRGFEYVSDVVKDYQFQTTTVTAPWANAHRDLLVRYLRAKIRAHRWLWDPAHRDEAIDVLVRSTKLSRENAAKTYALWFERQQRIIPRDGELNVKGLDHVVQDTVDAGLIKPGVDATRFVDQTFFEAAMKSLQTRPAAR